ncbi:DNA internalization-related competence protein ComEC/Rec2 [Microbulbifer agarilyticus]|uniref:DNA internalization-related competence protein ComEC/Rec2 n=1 Tax=Microbulbifer agarilyticus TaxID=260552 RepID=UPI001C95A60C|nr:DNA internalization-related competence protein ComEC/Rec2 [Microbulbifer agarilyticus]MBY6189272.1 DNA internalization-related competence protein ComEC/Rec2 [Microbulbifer agarilyticus]MBY6212346.1 DNA internalization-related competence protein ComEC/Rec2 [Microbulbifer agarilyticus]
MSRFGGSWRPSLTVGLWVCAIGIGQVAYWPRLPGNAGLASQILLLVGVLWLILFVSGSADTYRGGWRPLVYRLLFPFVFGTCWALASNLKSLEQRLPEDLHGSDQDLTVQVISLPQSAPAVSYFGAPLPAARGYRDVRFRARIAVAGDPRFLHQIVQLGWYRMAPDDVADLRAGSLWQIRVRLKQPRGSVNPHTFDYEAWLLEQGIYATGYVRDRDRQPELLAAGEGLDALREGIRDGLGGDGADTYASAPLMRALLLGDRGGIDDSTRGLLQRTGTAHLLAISGLHVGMVAVSFFFVGGLLGRMTGLLSSAPGLFRNPVGLAGAMGLLAATLYTLVSGAPLSAQRALLMTAVAIMAVILRRRLDGQLALALALCGVLMWQPLAVLNAGFWLSFIAVAVLLLRFQGRARVDGLSEKEGELQLRGRSVRVAFAALSNNVRSQLAIMVGLLIPSLMIFSGLSLTGLLVNLIAIPWVGLGILPLILLGAALPIEPLSAALWGLADAQLQWLLGFMRGVDEVAPGWLALPVPSTWLAVFGALSCLIWLLPKGLPGRGLAWLLVPVIASSILPFQRAQSPYLELSVLDVGQGLAVTAVTDEHALVFDAGAATAAGWSAGETVVAPYLRALGRETVDQLIVSHGDRDHAGGVAGLSEQIGVAESYSPGRLARHLAGILPEGTASKRCAAGESESLGSLTLTWLWPDVETGHAAVFPRLSGEENDHSCVALLQWSDVRILLTGDISSRVEQRLARQYPDFSPVDVLIAPHHGSRTSSSEVFIQWAQPANVVFSSGYRHHFGHPHQDVVARYSQFGSELFSTADMGAVQFVWRLGNAPADTICARDAGRFWLADGGARLCD